MRHTTSLAVMAILLITPYALAQQAPADQTQPALPAPPQNQQQQTVQPEPQNQSKAPEGTTPAPGGGSQPQSPEADLAAPAAIGPAQDKMASQMAHPTAPGATRTTIPSNQSAENAAQDKRPTMSFAFPLNDEQRKQIAASVTAAPDQKLTSKDQIQVTATLPDGIKLEPIPHEVAGSIAGSARYKYAKVNGRLLIVDSVSATVVRDMSDSVN